jgi:hypothetical protein
MANPEQPQLAFQNNQNFEIDIAHLYQEWVTGNSANTQNACIDGVRAQINIGIVQQSGESLLNSLITNGTTAPPNTDTPNTTTPGSTIQESRCHAFYRIIGFPVMSKDGKFYNPGHCPQIYKPIASGLSGPPDPYIATIDINAKVAIAKNPIAGFEQLSYARETWASTCLKLFSTPTSIDTSVFCLTSGSAGDQPNLRSFIALNKITGITDATIGNQSYGGYSNAFGFVENAPVAFSLYMDINGNSPSISGGLQPHKHIIFPLLVDGRIDFNVGPIASTISQGMSRIIAVPFLPDKTYLKLANNGYAERPYLETILRLRYDPVLLAAKSNVSSSGVAQQQIIEYLQNNKTIQDDKLLSRVVNGTSGTYNTQQEGALEYWILVIQSMMKKLVLSYNTVFQVQGFHYWLPFPSVTGPEGGSTFGPVLLSSALNDELITEPDKNIIIKTIQSNFNQQVISTVQTNTTPDMGAYALPPPKMTFDSNTSDSLGDNSTQTLADLVSKRGARLEQASNALATIEMIMGEFSGLGLCDIVAIIGSLSVMDPALLLEFLDTDALYRMNSIFPTLNLQKTNSISVAMTTLTSTMQTFYALMQSLFLAELNNNPRDQ